MQELRKFAPLLLFNVGQFCRKRPQLGCSFDYTLFKGFIELPERLRAGLRTSGPSGLGVRAKRQPLDGL